MNVPCQMELDSQLKHMNAQKLREERLRIDEELKELKEQIGDLAFNNYRTYVDAGRTTLDCTTIFSEMHTKLKGISEDVPALTEDVKKFFGKATKFNEESELVKAATDRTNLLWELIRLPSNMESYIRYGYYDQAYALTNYGVALQQHSIGKNPLIKTITDRIIEARSFLLEELFNKFSGPLDLAASIGVVNNVRKIPFLTGAQLRVSVLQYRDVYLEKQILDIAGHPEFALKAIDVYKECMYETIVLYTAVFPENEIAKKDPSVDPRWEPWPQCTPSTILADWAARNIRRLLEIIERVEMKSAGDMSAVWSSLMAFFSSFGRLGLDYRPLVVERLKTLVLTRFRVAISEATVSFHAIRSLNIVIVGFAAASANADPSLTLGDVGQTQAPTPSTDISAWDDLCVYGNALLEALNGLKYSLSPVMLSGVLSCLRESLSNTLSWLVATFGGTASVPASAHFARAVRLLGVDLVHFLNRCLLYYFPYSTVTRLFGSSISKEKYIRHIDLNIRALIAACDGNEKLEEVLLPILTKPKLSELDIDAIMKKQLEEESAGLPDAPIEPENQPHGQPAILEAPKNEADGHPTALEGASKKEWNAQPDALERAPDNEIVRHDGKPEGERVGIETREMERSTVEKEEEAAEISEQRSPRMSKKEAEAHLMNIGEEREGSTGEGEKMEQNEEDKTAEGQSQLSGNGPPTTNKEAASPKFVTTEQDELEFSKEMKEDWGWEEKDTVEGITVEEAPFEENHEEEPRSPLKKND